MKGNKVSVKYLCPLAHNDPGHGVDFPCHTVLPVSLMISVISLDPLEIPDFPAVAAPSPVHGVVLLGVISKHKSD